LSFLITTVYGQTAGISPDSVKKLKSFFVAQPDFEINREHNNSYNHIFHSAIKDKAGNLWFPTTGAGVYRYDGVTNEFRNFTRRDGLPSNNISDILEDKSGKLWISTDYGVCVNDPSKKNEENSFTIITTKESQCKDVLCICEDSDGNFWFGTSGYGVCRYNLSTGAFTNYQKENGLGSNTIQCILEDKAGNLWFGERAGGVCRFDEASGGFIKVNGDCLSSQIMGMLEDNSGNIWFANLYNGLCRYNGKSYSHFTDGKDLCGDTVTCIYEDRNGNIWFGNDRGKLSNNKGGGVCCYNPSSGVYTRYTTKDGLRNMDIWTIVEDNAGTIWVGSRGGGLCRFDSLSGKFIDFTEIVNK
jgi:ligand-binding sensor domain-containing protein